MANNINKFFITFIFIILMLLATAREVSAKDNLNYALITRHLLGVKGDRTTDNDLYYLACVARTHVERGKDATDIFHYNKSITPTLEQINIVRDVIDNKKNECYDLYMVFPYSIVADSSPGFIKVVCNDLAFISYQTFILLTVSPNL